MPGQPVCAACGGRLISSVVNFGDPMPQEELALAEEHARRCNLMLALGSSLMIQPAASLVGQALRYGARVVLVSRGKTPYDRKVTLRVPSSRPTPPRPTPITTTAIRFTFDLGAEGNVSLRLIA